MKHSGKARRAAFKLIFLTFLVGFIVWGLMAFASVVGAILSAIAVPALLVLWLLFSIFTLYFFRDPTPHVPEGAGLVISPAHGKVDAIDTITEPLVMGGECRRVSIFLSVFDIHVQNAPVTGKITFFKYSLGQFLNALKSESATHNENVLLGFESGSPAPSKIGVRLIAGVIARRIVPFVQQDEDVVRGQRISLIQFGSRADVYLPLTANVKVKLGDHVVGGETIIATLS
ncbi:MAG TPA: phosphatidylserine decarboxylase [Verrucomicrobiae bacterium]|nr:phosphatidylserine decarboxylase [Verrucomicrobiae bacterium]